MPLSPEQQLAAVSLAADMAAAEFARVAKARKLRWLLLKGPAIATRLYPDGEHRPYVDIDVLVAPRDYGRAEALLAELGFREAPHLPRQRVEHASPWRAPEKASVDLHRRVPHVPADPHVAWTVLTRDSESLRVAGEDVTVLSIPALALLVALHALHHGPAVAKPLRDLSLAAERLPQSAWEGARALSFEVGAERNLAAAMTLTPESRALTSSLALPRLRRWEITLRSGDPARVASAFALLRETPGVRRKVAALKDELVPKDLIGKAKGTEEEASTARTLGRRVLLAMLTGPGALAAWLLQVADVRRWRRRS